MHCLLGTCGSAASACIAAASACIAAASVATLFGRIGRLRCLLICHVGCRQHHTVGRWDSAHAALLLHFTLGTQRVLGLTRLCVAARAACMVLCGLVLFCLAARLACKVCGVGCSARSAGRRSTRHRRSIRTSAAGTRRVSRPCIRHAPSFGFGALMKCVDECGSCLVRPALKLCAYPSACASAALAAASAQAPAAAWPMQACLASSANTRRALCSRHCKRLGLGLARWPFHALPAWHTRFCRVGVHRCRVGVQLCPSVAFDALPFCHVGCRQHHMVG
jgi:hypothetical protein